MPECGRDVTRRRLLALAAAGLPLAAGCTNAGSDRAVGQEAAAETETQIADEGSRRDAVRCYAEGTERFRDGRELVFEGNGAFEDGNYHGASSVFERAAAEFEAARAEFEQGYEIVSWLDLEDERDERAALDLVEDAVRRVDHYLDAVASLRAAADRRSGGDAGGDHLETARGHLESAREYPIREASRLGEVLSVDAG